jgi:hypothetical protein
MGSRGSQHDNEGNGDDNELGQKLQSCNLGTDCPFEPALRRLQDEQHQRIKSESALATSLDKVSDRAQAVSLELEAVSRKLRDFTHEFERHIRQHRYFDLAVISIGAAIGGFLAKIIVP